jgi:hypothetical protein
MSAVRTERSNRTDGGDAQSSGRSIVGPAPALGWRPPFPCIGNDFAIDEDGEAVDDDVEAVHPPGGRGAADGATPCVPRCRTDSRPIAGDRADDDSHFHTRHVESLSQVSGRVRDRGRYVDVTRVGLTTKPRRL